MTDATEFRKSVAAEVQRRMRAAAAEEILEEPGTFRTPPASGAPRSPEQVEELEDLEEDQAGFEEKAESEPKEEDAEVEVAAAGESDGQTKEEPKIEVGRSSGTSQPPGAKVQERQRKTSVHGELAECSRTKGADFPFQLPEEPAVRQSDVNDSFEASEEEEPPPVKKTSPVKKTPPVKKRPAAKTREEEQPEPPKPVKKRPAAAKAKPVMKRPAGCSRVEKPENPEGLEAAVPDAAAPVLMKRPATSSPSSQSPKKQRAEIASSGIDMTAWDWEDSPDQTFKVSKHGHWEARFYVHIV